MFRRIIFLLEDYFGISRKEARGAFVLLLVSFVALWIPTMAKRWIFPLLSKEELVLNQVHLDSLTDQLADRYPRKDNYSTTRYPAKDKVKRPVRLSRFDPNTATPEQLEELGITPFLARRIVNFRSKGGKFRKKEDLQHIYDFPPELYRQLESYIVLPKKIEERSVVDHRKSFQQSKPQKIVPFDINTADTTQLLRLRGIGSKLSARILKYRDALGGFHSKEQFAEIFGLDSLALAQLISYTKIESALKKIPINTASVEELVRHPYFRNRQWTRIIVSYRQQHGPYRSEEDLKKTRVVDQAKLDLLLPYLDFETSTP
jgi:competence protein ComEA